MRGGSALSGVGRVVVTLFSMTAPEGEMLGIDPAERSRFVRSRRRRVRPLDRAVASS
jgi:hypothetical protein